MADFKNTKEGRLVAQKYADILHLSRPEPPAKHPRMSITNRAKIFSPFAALRGFDDEISSEGATKLLVKKVELSDEEKNNLSDKLLQVKKGMKVVVRYLRKDHREHRQIYESDRHSCYDRPSLSRAEGRARQRQKDCGHRERSAGHHPIR